MSPKADTPSTLRIRTVPHLANQLGIHPELLVEIAEQASELYTEFDREIKGKQRHLVMAVESLAPVQRRILDNVLCRLPVSKHAYGAIKGRGIRKNAIAHFNAAFLMKLDIRDFYPSIRYQRIYDFFIGQECSPDVARILTLLTTRKHSLPLGVSTSPFLADQIVRPVDKRISGLAKANKLNYTRYVDDIAISGRFDLGEIADIVFQIIKQAGFRIKRSKLEMYRPDDGKERVITGVRVENGRISARQAGLKLLRIYRRVKWRHLAWAQQTVPR